MPHLSDNRQLFEHPSSPALRSKYVYRFCTTYSFGTLCNCSESQDSEITSHIRDFEFSGTIMVRITIRIHEPIHHVSDGQVLCDQTLFLLYHLRNISHTIYKH